jgi:RNA-directed DNA polymerase
MTGQGKTGSAWIATQVQKPETTGWSWVEASVWTERMVSALVNGVKGGRWFSLIDRRLRLRRWRWRKSGPIGGSGVDGQSLSGSSSGAVSG